MGIESFTDYIVTTLGIRIDIIINYLPFLAQGAVATVGISLLGILFGSILGLFIGLGKLSTRWFIRFPFVWYINIFRGTPLLVQIFLIHFAVMPIILSKSSPLTSAIVALALNAAAYIAEIFRAGIQSIDRGQMEAARSLGMTHVQAMKEVILPQAFKRMIPPLGNEFIILLKDSSLAAMIAAPEIFYWSRLAGAQHSRVWEPYLFAALIYLILTLSLTYLLNYVERRLKTE
jgi:glutamine transport system permease protein